MASTSLYRYQRLSDNSIRILTVLPGTFGTALYVRISYLNLSAYDEESDPSESIPESQEDRYEAISYAWGSKARPRRLESVDGSYLEITESLYQALQHLRQHDRERRIWADAVCIDQGDLAERASQVAIMAKIFRLAARVLVWLGEATPGDVLAFGMLGASDRFYGNPAGVIESGDWIEEVLVKFPWCPCCKSNIPLEEIEEREGYWAVTELTYRDWFSRLWVYQEVACAAKVEIHCGFHYRAWESFEEFSNLEHQKLGPSDFEIVSMCRNMAGNSFDPNAFLRLLVILGEKECEEHHDRVFAIRSIAALEHVESLFPDYTLRLEELYRRVTVECLKQVDVDYRDPNQLPTFVNDAGNMGLGLPHISLLLALASIDEVSGEDDKRTQPSWVPTFHRFSNRALAKYFEYSRHLGSDFLWCNTQQLNTSTSWRDKKKVPRNGKLYVEFVPHNLSVLRIVGFRLGTVLKILERSGSPYAHEIDAGSYLDDFDAAEEALKNWISRCAEFAKFYGLTDAKQFKELVYCSSLRAGFDPDIYELIMEDFGGSSEGSDEEQWLEWIMGRFTESPWEDPLKKLGYLDHFRYLAAIAGNDGKTYLGWIPQSAISGDVVSVFYGCPRPFVIRSQKAGTFKLLGDSWIYGIPDNISFRVPQSIMKWFPLT